MNELGTDYIIYTYTLTGGFLMSYNIHNDGDDQITNTAGEFQSDGRDIEFSLELADQDDLTAQARSKAADKRAKARGNNNNH